MKAMKLFTVLLAAILFLSAAYAMNVEEVKTHEKNSDAKKSAEQKFWEAKFIPKAHNDANWTRKSYGQDYTPGVIRTH